MSAMAALITHERSLRLIGLAKQCSANTDVIMLPLPSRFPARPLLTTISPTGQIYLYASGGNVVWEYDSKGGRISEIALHGEEVERVLALGTGVVVCSKGMLRIKEKKDDGKWAQTNSLGIVGLLSTLV